MTNQKSRSLGSRLLILSLALVLFSLLAGTAAAADGSEKDDRAASGPALAMRPRRVNVSETTFGRLLWTSDVLYRTMPKLIASDGSLEVAAPLDPVIGLTQKQGAPLADWPGLALRESSPSGGALAATPTAYTHAPDRRALMVPSDLDWGTDSSAQGASSGGQGQARRRTVSTAPMTAGEKFKYFFRKSFLSPEPYGLSVLAGVFGEAFDTDDKKHRSDAGEFMADSMTRAARAFAFRATANFFEKFAYATMFKQDPRYHRSNNTGFGARVGYAISRVFVTQGDRGGSQFNASFIFGGLTAAGISNLWERDEHVNVGSTFSRWGAHVGFTALSNILREYIGGQ